MTRSYLGRPEDSRMTMLISRHVPQCGRLLDLGCGSGLYGATLKRYCDTLIGMDMDPKLCEVALAKGGYDDMVTGDIRALDRLVAPVDVIFCSEVLEHVPNEELRAVIDRMESVCAKRIVITVPNPLSPHFRHDPTHCLRYSIYSLLETLRQSDRFAYTLLPLGFSEYNLATHPVFRAINPVSSRIPLASPTVAYVGDRLPG